MITIHQHAGQDVHVHVARWGLVPMYTKPDDKPDFFRMVVTRVCVLLTTNPSTSSLNPLIPQFNARSETVAEKSAFRRLVPSKRCIVLVNGFYEWKKEKDGKQPYYIYDKDAPVLQLAGLWDVWKSADGPMGMGALCLYSVQVLQNSCAHCCEYAHLCEQQLHSPTSTQSHHPPPETFTILTTDSAKRLTWLHDRQPVMLMTREARDAWLKEGPLSAGDLEQLCRPYNGDNLVWHPVTRAMNTAQYQGDDCAKEVKKSPGITAFFKPVAKKKEEGKTGKEEGTVAKALFPTKRPAEDVKEDDVGTKKVKQEIKNSV